MNESSRVRGRMRDRTRAKGDNDGSEKVSGDGAAGCTGENVVPGVERDVECDWAIRSEFSDGGYWLAGGCARAISERES